MFRQFMFASTVLGLMIITLGVSIVEAKEPSRTQIAVFRDESFGLNGSVTKLIAQALDTAGMKVEFIDSYCLSKKERFNRDKFSLLVYAGGKTYPASALGNIQTFLESGGNMIVLGGPPFSEPAWKKGDMWVTHEGLKQILKEEKPSNLLFGFENPSEAAGWSRGTDNTGSPSNIQLGDYGSGKGKSLLFDISNLTGWDTWAHEVRGIPEGHGFFCFFAKGDEKTQQIAIELNEKDGSRWIATVNISPDWAYYVLTPIDFKYWHDNPSKGRGGSGDVVKLQNVHTLSIGLSFSHTSVGGGAHKFWIDEISTAPGPIVKGDSELVLDGLTPEYKVFPVRNIDRVAVSPNQIFLKAVNCPTPQDIFSCSPRPQGTGFLKERLMRFVPLIETYGVDGKRSGYLAWMFINGCYIKSNQWAGSTWACFGTNDPSFYKDPAIIDSIVDLARKMVEGIYLYEGGAQHYAYFHDEESVRLGATVACFPKNGASGFPPGLSVRITVKAANGEDVAFQKEFDLDTDYKTVATSWETGGFTSDKYAVTTELLKEGKTIDILSHELNIWRPKPSQERHYMTVKDGEFYLDGKRWYAHGVNYMPSSGIATEDNEYFEYWLDPRAYDPLVIEEDLSRIEDMGMNMVSVFIYHRSIGSMNLLDLLMRCEKHHLLVNLSLRPNADPLFFSEEEVREIITTYHLWENDNVFAYDLAWERSWGTYEPSYSNVKGRKGYDSEWEKWVIERYENIENAEKDWNYPCPRTGGKVTGPSDSQLQANGPWNRMVAAYRRFVDDFVGKKHSIAAQAIHKIDPHHLISFRMGGDTGDPTADPARFGYDFRGLAKSMDIMEPEGYGRIGDWDKVRDGAFTAAYARYAAPGRPVLWAEFGRHVWSGSNFLRENSALDVQASFYNDFYRMILLSHANGTVSWWYPGGYRWNEKSDYGILNPEGSKRPVTDIIESYAKTIKGKDSLPAIDYWITVDRDADARGIYGIYEKVKDEFWRAIEAGKFPGLRDEGMGTTSLNTPLLAVGNTPYNGTNPPKYLNAQFNYIEIKDAKGNWVEVNDGSIIEVREDQPVSCRASVGNTQVATWIAPANAGEQDGAVYLATPKGSEIQIQAGIPADIPYLGDAQIAEFRLVGSLDRQTRVVLQMTALNRMWFGESIEFRLVPID